MKNHIRAVGEDWDDFKVVSQKIKIQHHIAVAKDFGVQDLTAEKVIAVWGSGLRMEMASYYGHPDPRNVSDEDHNRFLAAFEARDAEFPKQLQTDTRESHDRLVRSHLPMFVVTSHLTKNAVKEMGMVGINSGDYQFIHGSDITVAKKPDPAAFDQAKAMLANMGIAPEEAIYGGDTIADGQSATEAGLQFLGVTTGNVSAQEFSDAHFNSVPNLRQFTDYVLFHAMG